MKPYVKKHPMGDWYFHCEEHDEGMWSFSWESAYEAAVGHIAMHHKPNPAKCYACSLWTFRTASWQAPHEA